MLDSGPRSRACDAGVKTRNKSDSEHDGRLSVDARTDERFEVKVLLDGCSNMALLAWIEVDRADCTDFGDWARSMDSGVASRPLLSGDGEDAGLFLEDGY